MLPRACWRSSTSAVMSIKLSMCTGFTSLHSLGLGATPPELDTRKLFLMPRSPLTKGEGICYLIGFYNVGLLVAQLVVIGQYAMGRSLMDRKIDTIILESNHHFEFLPNYDYYFFFPALPIPLVSKKNPRFLTHVYQSTCKTRYPTTAKPST